MKTGLALSIKQTVETLMPNSEELLNAEAKGLLIPDYGEPLVAVAFDLHPYKVSVGKGTIEDVQLDMLNGKPPYWKQAADRSRAALKQLVRPHGLQVHFHSHEATLLLCDNDIKTVVYWNAVIFTLVGMSTMKIRRLLPTWQEPKDTAYL